MDYKELMCGDLVKVEQTTEVVNAKVLGVYKDGINYEVDYSGVRATNQIHTDYVSPIELTEEILVKNGFEKTKGGEYERTRYVMFSDKSWVALYTREAGGYSAFLNKIVVIHYVHQLQHLLRLCGVEKELVID